MPTVVTPSALQNRASLQPGPKFLHGASYTGATFAASGGPWYLPISGNFPGNAGAAGQVGLATEAAAQMTIQRPCIISNLTATSLTVGASTSAAIVLRVNGLDATNTVTLATTNTAYRDSFHTDYLQPGDKVCWKVTVTGANTVAMNAMGCLIQPLLRGGETPSWITMLPSDNPPPNVSAGVTAYGTAFGTGTTGGLTEAPWKVTARNGFELGLAEAYILTNTLSASYASKLRRNGADASSILTIAAGFTGRILDGHIDAYTPGDQYGFTAVVGAGTGAATASFGSFYGFGPMRPYAVFLRTGQASNNKRVMPLEGEAHAASLVTTAGAALIAHATLTPYRFFKMSVLPITNTKNGNTVITLLSGTGDTALTVTIPAGSTTAVEDTTHTVDFLVPASDYASIALDCTASSSGTFGPAFITVEGMPL